MNDESDDSGEHSRVSEQDRLRMACKPSNAALNDDNMDDGSHNLIIEVCLIYFELEIEFANRNLQMLALFV